MTQTTDRQYKWASPEEWLRTLIQTRVAASDHEGVEELLMSLVNSGKLDSDDLQDIFQSDMSEDGYFTPLTSDADIEAVAGKLVYLTYECRDIGNGVESGETEGTFTGERDSVGKWTFTIEGGETMYLFTDEVKIIEVTA